MQDGAQTPLSVSLRIDEGLWSMVIGYILSPKVYPSLASAYPVAHDASPFTIEAYTSSKLVYASFVNHTSSNDEAYVLTHNTYSVCMKGCLTN